MGNKRIDIKTPRGTITTVTTKNGKIVAKLDWNKGFGPQKTGDFNGAQKFVDSEVLRLCSPYVPFQTGMLQKSGNLGTIIGSGEVNWIAPYAAPQYYSTSETRGYDAQCGGQWFPRMKVDHGKEIINGAKRKGGGK